MDYFYQCLIKLIKKNIEIISIVATMQQIFDLARQFCKMSYIRYNERSIV